MVRGGEPQKHLYDSIIVLESICRCEKACCVVCTMYHAPCVDERLGADGNVPTACSSLWGVLRIHSRAASFLVQNIYSQGTWGACQYLVPAVPLTDHDRIPGLMHEAQNSSEWFNEGP